MLKGKDGLSSLLIGIIFLVVNCAMLGMAFFGPGFLYGGIFIIVPICGLVSGFKAVKEDNQRVLGIVGIILNAINTLSSLGIIILGFISKLAN